MKTLKKCLAMFLALLTLFSICSTSTTVFAAEYAEQKVRTEYFDSALSGYLKNIVDTEDAVSISEKEQVDQTVEEVNSSVARTVSTFSLRATPVQSTETAKEAAEDLDIDHTRLTLELEDGENVAYLFSEPISFIDDEGNLVYKDTNIKTVTDSVILNRGYSYENGNNDYRAYFSEDSARGLLLVDKDGEEVRLVPNGTKVVGTLVKVESDMKLVDSFEYNGVYGTDTVLRFLPQLNGCKEEIVLSSYQGISDFSFTLYTQNGTIAAINSSGEVEIINAATKDIITTFVAPFANDSSGGLDVTSEHYTDCTYELEMIAEGKYILTISVPKEYLESENTVYPVIIDPTTDNISMYLDTSVYSALSDEPQGANPTACFGKTDTSEYGKGRAMFYFKLPTDIKNYAQISSAKFWLRETTGRTAEMYVRPYLISESWTNQVTWDTQPKYYNGTADYPGKSNFSLPRRNINSASTDDPESPYWYAFNIVYAVRAWTTGTTNLGLKFIAECEAADGDYLWRAFATKDHTTSSYRPYVVISYTNDATKPTISSVSGNPTEWTKDNVTLTVTATDNVYGANGIAGYSFDNGESWQTGKTKTFSKNQTVYIKVKDKAGNISAVTTVKITKIDKTAPVVESITKSPTSEWSNANVKVTLDATDALSGIRETNGYSFNGGAGWRDTNNKTYSDEGTYTITGIARDKAGNTKESGEISVKIDKTKPVVDKVNNPKNGVWVNTDVTVSITASDTQSSVVNSGIATSGGYSFNGGSNWQKGNSKTYSSEGTYTVTAQAKDKAGNKSATVSGGTVKIDKTAPVVSSPTKSPNTEWSNTNVTVTNNATDALSGIASSNGYSFNNGSSWQDGKTKTYSNEGTYTVTPKAKDKASNTGTGTEISVKIDKTAPIISKIEKSPSSEWSKTDVKVTVTASDALSGIATSSGYSFDNGTNWQTNNYKTYSNEGTYTVTAIVKDKATNKSASKTTTVKIDKTAPTATVTGTVNGSTVDVTVTASDALSGLHATAYSFDGGTNWQSSNTKKSLSANTTHTIVIRDKADNRTTIKYNPKIGSVVASPSLDTWTNGKVTLTASGTNISQYKFDSGSWSATEKSKSYSENATAKVGFKESSGNITYINVHITNIDSEKPVITSVTLQPKSGWVNQNVTATVNASDTGGSGIFVYSSDNGNSWQTSNVFTFSDLTEAKFLVKDNAGNSSEVLSKEILIDKDAPTLDLTGGCDDWSNEPITVIADANDEGGSDIFGYSFDGGNAWVTDNRKVYEESTNEIVSVIVKDNAGNITEKTAQVMVDIDTPVISNVALSSTSWTKENVIITVTASDVMSGLADTAYSFDGGTTWQEDNTYTASENGTFNIVVKDKADNETSWDEIVIDYIDKTIPNTPDLYEQDGLVYISSRSFGFNEETDSPEHIEYKIENGEWTAYDGEPLNIVRTYGATVYARVVDAAHNGEDGSNVTSITLENNLGEYTVSYTDIALGEGLFPVEFGRTYTSTNGWFFTFDANVAEIDDNAYVFTDFYGEKQYFIKNSKGQYFSVDEEELTIVESTDEETGNKIKNYRLNYGDMIVELGNNCKLSRITTDYTTTEYKWNADGSLTIDGGAVVNFDKNFRPTSIVITRKENKDGVITDKTKTVVFTWENDKLMKFTDAMNGEHAYGYDEETGLLITNDTETISYSNGRVRLISQPNGAFVKYTYNDNATNAEAPNNVGAVTVSDSKGVTDTIYYADGVYIKSYMDGYGENAVYAPNSISNALTQDSVADIVYVVEEPQEDESADGADVEIDEETGETENTENEPEYTYDENGNVLTETYSSTVGGQNVIVDKYVYTYTEDNKLATEKYYAVDESNVLCLVSEYVYDMDENIISELYYTQETVNEETADVISESYTREYSGENMTSEIYQKRVDGELVNQEKAVYSYDDKGNVATESICQWIVNAWYQSYCEEYTYDNYDNALSQTASEYKNTVNAETGLVETTSDIVTVDYEYDVWNQQIKVTESVNETENTITTVVYDALGRVVSVAEDDELTAYTYDSKDNILTVTEDEEVTTYTYSDNGNLVSRTNPNGTVASYVYDSYGNLTNHAFNGYAFTYNTLGSILTANSESGQLVNYTYSSTVEQDVLNVNFGNGQSIVYDYNEDGEITAIKLGEETKYGYEYLETTDENGEVTKEWAELTDYVSGIKKVIEESKLTVNDLNGNFIYSIENVSKDEEVEDSFNGTVTTIGSDVYTLVTEENKDTFKTNGTTDFTKEYTYVNDELSKICTAGITTSYDYNAENFISILENTLSDVSQVYGYAYDDNGNITTETLTTTSKDENGATVETNESIHYTYDDKEQLISAETSSVKYEYTYDDRGNILTEKEYSISLDENNQKVYTLIESGTDIYAYDETWKDKLISYNGQSIAYDAVGNPTNYMGNALTWTMGRQLATFGNISYIYNEDGIRTSKTSNGVTTKFLLDGYNIIEQTDGTTTLHFFHDSNGEVIGFRYNGNDYFYVKNAMSDIIAITDSNKNIVAEYRYDPWGKVLGEEDLTTIGNLNPFRYRSYYYDNDIKMYYLQSRYYDAEVGRFINCDDVNYIGITELELSYNSFAYCENNAINSYDYTGYNYDKSYFATNVLPFYTMLHNAVVYGATLYLNMQNYKCKNQVATYANKNKKTKPNGYMDIYSVKHNLVWEVKRNNAKGIKAGGNQLNTYTKSYVKSNGYKKPKLSDKKIVGTVQWEQYLISYSTHIVRGLIVYDYECLNKNGTPNFKKLWNKAKKYVSIPVTIVVAAVAIGSLIYYVTTTGDVYTFAQKTKEVAIVAFENVSKAA